MKEGFNNLGNGDSLYREFSGEDALTDVFELFARMATLAGYDQAR